MFKLNVGYFFTNLHIAKPIDMPFQLDELTINITKLNVPDLLSAWKWLLRDVEQVLLVSKMGDLFYQRKDGAIFWLATDNGTLRKVAENNQEFQKLLLDEDNLDNWFLPSLIASNLEPTDASVHFAIAGQICEKIKNLPNGTSIKLKITD